jgi:hypothetical protein
MKKIKIIALTAITFVIIASTIFVSCKKQEKLVNTTVKTKSTRAPKTPKCNRDYIIVGMPGPTTVKCPKGGTLCYRDKKGNHGCGEYSDPKSKVANYTNLNGSINTIEYFQKEDYSILFGDVNLYPTLLNEINTGTLHLYLMPWVDGTEITETDEDNSNCQSSTYVLSRANNIDEVNSSNITLIWIY